MKHNVGGWDRDLRLVAGSAAIVAGMLAPVSTGWRAGLVALGSAELFTATTRYCPLNEALGVNTNVPEPVERAKEVAEAIA
jgi:hypothetical protein